MTKTVTDHVTDLSGRHQGIAAVFFHQLKQKTRQYAAFDNIVDVRLLANVLNHFQTKPR
ncbi:hypothetical protein [Veronia pacifica]|uniref:hypothetical protein n=1 Tax=Veronia pacifica TaxID=1080227 RepID=UPI00158644F4